MGYIGQGQPTLGDETNDARAKGNVVATTGVMTRTLGGASRRLGLSGGGAPAPAPASKDRDHMQVDAAGQQHAGGKGSTKSTRDTNI